LSVIENLADVSARIASTGRNLDEVTIVAVTKGFDVSVCRLALEAGLRILGENRVQEAMKKMDEVPEADWHLIGHLQTNKVKQAAGRFALIQTVDSVRLADAIASHAPNQAVLVEVNIAREPQRSGAAPEDALELIVVRNWYFAIDPRGNRGNASGSIRNFSHRLTLTLDLNG